MVVDRKNQKALALLYLASKPLRKAANSSGVPTEFEQNRPQGPEERSSSRTFSFPCEDNRHKLLRTCVTRVTYIITAGQITVGS